MEKFVLFALGTVIVIGVIFFTADFLAKMYYSAIHTPNIRNSQIIKRLILKNLTVKKSNHGIDSDQQSIGMFLESTNYTRQLLVNLLNNCKFSFGVFGTQHWLLEVNKYRQSKVGHEYIVENIEISLLNEYSIERNNSEDKVTVSELRSIILLLTVRHFINEKGELVSTIESIEPVKGGNILFNSKK